ncbi:MAG: YihY family inner membrane protein [Lysobacteraceae bacterium]
MRLFDSLIPQATRERAGSFFRFLARRFVDDRCFDSASALAYATLFALVPLFAVVFGVVSMFPLYQTWVDKLTGFVFANFVPGAANTVADFLREAAVNARGLPGLGILVVLATALLTLNRIETTFNRIWRVATPRRFLARLLIYWAALTLLPLLAVASLAVSSYLASVPLFGENGAQVPRGLLGLLPVGLEFVAFALAYWLIPNRSVRLSHAALAALLATALFEAAKFGFAVYLSNANYQALYGAIAVIPIFLVWIYLSWVVVLLGASFAASLSAFRYQPAATRLKPGDELYGMLRLIGRFSQLRRTGGSFHTAELVQLEPTISDDLLMRLLADLSRVQLIRRTEEGGYALVRDLSQTSLGELIQAAGLRLPADDAALPEANDAIGRRAVAVLDLLRQPLREPLRRSLADVLQCDVLQSADAKGTEPA